MKRSFVLFCTLMVGALSFSSCNKKLKDELNELKNQVGVDAPITVTTTFVDAKNVNRTVTGNYKIRDGASDANALIKNSDGTYEISIERSDANHGDEGVSLKFVYDPATKKFLHKQIGHYWTDYNSNGEASAFEYETPTPGITFNLDLKDLNLETGDISFEVKIEATKEYSQNYQWSVPNRDAGFTSAYKFSGKLKKFERNNAPS